MGCELCRELVIYKLEGIYLLDLRIGQGSSTSVGIRCLGGGAPGVLTPGMAVTIDEIAVC